MTFLKLCFCLHESLQVKQYSLYCLSISSAAIAKESIYKVNKKTLTYI